MGIDVAGTVAGAGVVAAYLNADTADLDVDVDCDEVGMAVEDIGEEASARHGADGWVDHPCGWVAGATQRREGHQDH